MRPVFLCCSRRTVTPAISYRSGMPSLKDVAVELGVGAARVVGDECKLGINGPGGGQRDSAQSMSHQECLQAQAQEPEMSV